MPTVCELKIEAKKQGLKGYSKLNKSQLQALISGQRSGRRPTVTQPKNPPFLFGTGRNPYD